MNIGLIGTGNIAQFLLQRLQHSDKQITHIYGRSKIQLEKISQQYQVVITEDYDSLTSVCDIVFLCVNDDAIYNVASQLKINENQIVIHTSGSQSVSLLKDITINSAVIWPIFSINAHDLPESREIPLILTSNNEAINDSISALASIISNQQRWVDDQQKQYLHLQATITNNFFNHLCAMAEEIGKEHALSLDLMKPIIQQTVNRIGRTDIKDMQTGAAVRRDYTTMGKHVELLKDHEEWQQLYKQISQSIINYHKDSIYE